MHSIIQKLNDLILAKMQSGIPIKPRRKKIDVQVHQSDRRNDAELIRKTFSANHPRKEKHRKSPDLETKDLKSPPREEYDDGERISGKLKKKLLLKENEELLNENNELRERLTSMDGYINKKNKKFKEKLDSVMALNQQLMTRFRECENELQVCQKCTELGAIIEKQRHEFASLSKTTQEVDEDLSMLKNVVYRLNVQLERYQQKLHSSKTNLKSRPTSVESISNPETPNIFTDNHKDHPHTPVSWGKVNAHTLGPLLDAYQDTIMEREGIIGEYEQELASFMEKMRDVISENEALYKLLNEDEDCSKVLSDELQNVKGELKNTKEQNDLLIKKCALKQDKVDEVLKCYEEKLEMLKRDHKVLLDDYYKSKTEAAALREKIKQLLQAQSDFKNERQEYIPVTVHTASVNECKKWYEELKHQYELEKVKLKETNNELTSRLGETQDKIAAVNKEKAELEEKVKAAEKQIKKLETKYLELQHTVNEVQVSRSACRKQLHKAMSFAKDLVAEQEALLKALNQRQKENKAVKKLGSDIVNRMDTLRSQLKTVQQEAYQELSTVEERMQEQDSLINALKKEHNEEVEHLKQIIKDMEGKSLVLKENPAITMPHYLLFREKNMNK